MQGTQEEIPLFGRPTKVGFYNSFCPAPGSDVHANLGVLGKNAEVRLRATSEEQSCSACIATSFTSRNCFLPYS